MKKTLEQYIDPDNIPRQYGGRLDYKFGELPNLEPVITNTLDWSAPEKLNGRNTIPTGPILWKTESNGTLNAIAVGTQNNRPRDRKVASIAPQEKVNMADLGAGAQQAHQQKQDNLAVRQKQMYRTTSGIDTHPTTTNDVDLSPPSPEYPTNDAPISNSTGGTYLSYRDGPPLQTESQYQPSQYQTSQSQYEPTYASSTHQNASINHPNPSQQGQNTISTDRSGTSSTRYADQSSTHAHGTLGSGTPSVRDEGHGASHSVMDPNTVGQAPKEHPMPEPETTAPSYLEQAQALAGQAGAAVSGAGSAALAAVGYGGGQTTAAETEKAEEQQQERRIPHDPAVDAAGDRSVEDFLRDQYKSKAATTASAENKGR